MNWDAFKQLLTEYHIGNPVEWRAPSGAWRQGHVVETNWSGGAGATWSTEIVVDVSGGRHRVRDSEIAERLRKPGLLLVNDPHDTKPADPEAVRAWYTQLLVTDPLDVEYDGVRLRTLLHRDSVRRREEFIDTEYERDPGLQQLTIAQRAAISAHWSAALRAKVAASAAADKAREVSVRCDSGEADE